MTSEDINNLELGPDMDALIAEKVMGLEVLDFYGFKRVRDENPIYSPETKVYKLAEPYSTEIYAAWIVFMHLKELGYTITITNLSEDWDFENLAVCQLEHSKRRWVAAAGKTIPAAICRAALKTVREDHD